MDDDYDIYGDLDELEVESQKENKVIRQLNTQIEELNAKITEKEQEKQEIANKNAILLENISTLLLTAKAELKRKDALIADIRRERDNTVFRRGNRQVRKHDRYTQTTLIHIDREVQTEFREEKPKSKDATLARRIDRRRERSLSRVRDASRDRRQIRAKSRSVDIFVRPKSVSRRDLRYKIRSSLDQNRKRQRDSEQRARRANRTPDLDRKRSTVRFRSPVRVKSKPDGLCQSDSYVGLSNTFIPMNEKELDRYVKEIGRRENRLPTREMKKAVQSTTEKSSKRSKSESGDIIQSDEIGTTALGGNGLVEDLERKLTALHGESTPKTPQINPGIMQTSIELLEDLRRDDTPPPLPRLPPPVVPPPPEPPIFEQVPEFPLDDDPRLNDSRELRIVESDEIVGTAETSEHLIECSISASLPVEELEDGELPSSDDEQIKEGETKAEDDCKKRRDHDVDKSQQKRSKVAEISEVRKESKHKTADATILHEKSQHFSRNKSFSEERSCLSPRSKSKIEKCRSRSRTLTEPSLDERVHSKERRGEALTPLPYNSRKEKTLKELFGTDDENSLAGSPKVTHKRRPSSEWNGLEHDKKKKKKAVISSCEGIKSIIENQTPLVEHGEEIRHLNASKHRKHVSRSNEFGKERDSARSETQSVEPKLVLHQAHARHEKSDRKEESRHRSKESAKSTENKLECDSNSHSEFGKHVVQKAITTQHQKIEDNLHFKRKESDKREATVPMEDEHVKEQLHAGHIMITRRRKSMHGESLESKENQKRRKSTNQEEPLQTEKTVEQSSDQQRATEVQKTENSMELVKEKPDRKRRRSGQQENVTVPGEAATQRGYSRMVETVELKSTAEQDQFTVQRNECAAEQVLSRIEYSRSEVCESNKRVRVEKVTSGTKPARVGAHQTKPDIDKHKANGRHRRSGQQEAATVDEETVMQCKNSQVMEPVKNTVNQDKSIIQEQLSHNLVSTSIKDKSESKELKIIKPLPVDKNSSEAKLAAQEEFVDLTEPETVHKQIERNSTTASSSLSDPAQKMVHDYQEITVARQEEPTGQETPVLYKESVGQDDLVEQEVHEIDDIPAAAEEQIVDQIQTGQTNQCDTLLPTDKELPQFGEQQADPEPVNILVEDKDLLQHKESDNSFATQVHTADSETPTHDTSILLGRYCEYRIAFDNETETTVVVTRKKRKKFKPKNTSLNVSETDHQKTD